MNNINNLSEVLISLNDVYDKNHIVGLTTEGKIVTKEHHDINKFVVETLEPESQEETFEAEVTRLKDRLIDLNINIEKNYLTAENIAKQIKKEIIDLFPGEENVEENIEAIIEQSMPDIISQNTNIKDQAKKLATEFEVGVMLDLKLKKTLLKERNEKARQNLLKEIQHSLNCAGKIFKKHGYDFSSDIKNEILKYKDKNLEELKKINSSAKNRRILASCEMIEIKNKYESLLFNIKANMSIFEYHKQISDLMDLMNVSFKEAFKFINF